MTSKRPFGLPSARLIVIAAIAGILAGAVAVYVRNMGSGNAGHETVSAQSAGQCEGAAKITAAVKQLSIGQVAAMTAAQPPRPLQVSFRNGDGKELKTADFAGKTVLLNLWATWCVPCREEMPALNALQKELGSDRFEVVAVNIDSGSDDKPRNFIREHGIDQLGFYRDGSMGVFNALKKEGLAFGLPATLLMDANGCLISSMNGPAVWDSADAKALVKAAVGL